jgi:acyl-CoA reductase-like NAD-dependent aldehyde dehydrogenase
MKHWKVLHVDAYKKTISSWDQFMVKLEDGLTMEMLIDHLEPSIKTPFANLNQILTSLASLRVQLRTDEQQLAAWANRSAIAVKRQHEALARQIAEERRELAKLEADHQTTEAQCAAARRVPFLAMFTGRNYASLPVWDCGQRK